MILYRIQPREIEPDDVRWLSVGCIQCKWDRITPAGIVEKALDGDLMLYRIIGTRSAGVLVLSVDAGRSRLWIELFAGKGLMKEQDEFRNLLRMMGQGLGLREIAGFVSRDALAKWYDRHTPGKPVATLYVEEIV